MVKVGEIILVKIQRIKTAAPVLPGSHGEDNSPVSSPGQHKALVVIGMLSDQIDSSG